MEDTDKGLYLKYKLEHSDGSPIDPNAKYFVLRYDENDPYGNASRIALDAYARAIRVNNVELSNDLMAELAEYYSLRQPTIANLMKVRAYDEVINLMHSGQVTTLVGMLEALKGLKDSAK